MDLAANDLEKTSAVKREAMVCKLHNMQWLKNTSNSTSSGKVKTLCKQKDHDEDDEIEDKVLMMEDNKPNSTKESCEHHLTMDTCTKDLSNDSVVEYDAHFCGKDMDTSNMLLNAHPLVVQKVEEKEISSMAIQENLITLQLETHCHINEEHKHQENVSENINILQDETQNDGPNIPESQKINQDTKNPDLTYSDKNNNNGKSMILDMSKENILKSSENDKILTDTKSKDAYIKKTDIPKTNIKSANNTTLSKCCSDKPFHSVVNSKRSLSNLSKSMSFSDKHGKTERVINKHTFTKKNSFTKDESVKHSCFPTKGIENKAKDVTGKSGLSKTDLEKELNKTTDINQNDQRTHCSSHIVSSNKDKTLHIHQRTSAKQCTPKSKGQEFPRSNISSLLNRTFDKNKVSEKMEETTHVSRNSDSFLRESEKKNSDKNVSNDQKPYASNRNTTFFKNSTLSRSVKTKNISEDVGNAPTYGRNPLYARNNPTPDTQRVGNIEYKAVAKVKKDCQSTDTLPNVNTESEESCANNLEADKKQQCEKHKDAQSTNVHKADAPVPNNENNSIEDKKPANVEDCTKQTPITPEETCKTETTNDDIKADDQQSIVTNNKVDNEEFKPSKDSLGLRLDKSCTRPQTYPISSHIFNPEDTQQTDANQTKNGPIMCSDLNDPLRRNISVQHSVQSMHSQQTIIQTENHVRQTSLREMDCGRFYDQRLPMNEMTRPPQVPNTFDTAPYEYNMQATSNDNDATTMFDTMSGNRENSNVPHRYTSNMQQKPFTPLSDLSGHTVPASQVSRWNFSLHDGFHMEQFVNATPPATMHVYNNAAFGQDDFNGAQIPAANCLPAHHLLYTPYMHTWNSQLHYPTPIFHNPPCTSYTVVPNVNSQSNSYSDVNVTPLSMCMHEQPQHRYIHYIPGNSNAAMHMHPNYMKSMYDYDLNCEVETRNTAVDDSSMRPSRHYKRYQDNCRVAYDVPQYTTSVSQPISRAQHQQQHFAPAGVNQYNIYNTPGQKYYKQNAMNFTQPSSNGPKGQKTQDLVCEDNSLEDIPPIISPKEFMTNNVNFPNKTDQFPPRMFKPDFKMRPNTGYRQSSFQRYNSGFRRNTHQDFPKEYASSVGVGRGISKTIQNTKM